MEKAMLIDYRTGATMRGATMAEQTLGAAAKDGLFRAEDRTCLVEMVTVGTAPETRGSRIARALSDLAETRRREGLSHARTINETEQARALGAAESQIADALR